MQDRVAALIELGREKKFTYQRHFLPHDVGTREWGNGAKTRVQTLVELGVKLETIHRGVAQNPIERINASRRLLPIVRFHRTARVMLGLQRLRRYSRKKNDALGTYVGVLRDENTHGSDAFGEFAVNCGIKPEKKPEPKKPVAAPGQVPLPPPPQPTSGSRMRI